MVSFVQSPARGSHARNSAAGLSSAESSARYPAKGHPGKPTPSHLRGVNYSVTCVWSTARVSPARVHLRSDNLLDVQLAKVSFARGRQ